MTSINMVDQRLVDFFLSADCCSADDRMMGVEVETLFVDRNGVPINRYILQDVFGEMAKSSQWSIAKMAGGLITALVHRNGWSLTVDLGCNDLELTSRPYHFKAFPWTEQEQILEDIYEFAQKFGVSPLKASYDGHEDVDTLMVPDDRDRAWIDLDGQENLIPIGHIASVNYNIDLSSVDEGMHWINILRDGYHQPLVGHHTSLMHEHDQIWRRYIRESRANYQEWRYGHMAGNTFELYCWWLSTINVVMQRDVNGKLSPCKPAKPLFMTEDVDIDLFLRSVWLYDRLRVRNGRLALEIRNVPRGSDALILSEWEVIARKVGLLQAKELVTG